jgi:hypothetical protein
MSNYKKKTRDIFGEETSKKEGMMKKGFDENPEEDTAAPERTKKSTFYPRAHEKVAPPKER